MHSHSSTSNNIVNNVKIYMKKKAILLKYAAGAKV